MIKQLKKWIEALLEAFAARDDYRPERHYMGGPGPESAAPAQGGPPTGNAKGRSQKGCAGGATG
jgi:hypothetical protein